VSRGCERSRAGEPPRKRATPKRALVRETARANLAIASRSLPRERLAEPLALNRRLVAHRRKGALTGHRRLVLPGAATRQRQQGRHGCTKKHRSSPHGSHTGTLVGSAHRGDATPNHDQSSSLAACDINEIRRRSGWPAGRHAFGANAVGTGRLGSVNSGL
jgi:hypothetical protein